MGTLWEFHGYFRTGRNPIAPFIFLAAEEETRGVIRQMQCKEFQLNQRMDFHQPQGDYGSGPLKDPEKLRGRSTGQEEGVSRWA